MMSSRVIGYVLLLILVGAVLLSFLILGIQWVRSEDDKSKGIVTPTVRMIQPETLSSVQIVYHNQPDFRIGV
jgi:hypothetical protein